MGEVSPSLHMLLLMTEALPPRLERQSDEIELPIPPQKHELYRSPAPAGHERSRDDTRSTSMGQQPEIVLFRPSDSEREVDVQGQDRFPSWPSLQAEISREDYTHSLDFPGPDARLALPLQDSGLHQKVTYSLDLTFLRPDSPSLRIVALLPPFPYDDIGKFAEQFMTRHVQDTCPHELVDKELLFRTGTATIDTIGDKESYDLSMKSDWDLQLINKPNNIGPIHVEIHRDYIALRNCAETNKTFASTKRDEIASLKCKAANKLKYFPRIDIELIACRGTIEKVVAEDSTSAMNSAEKEEFANTIYQNAQILFASCVRAQLRMECLKLLLDRGWNDAKLRLTPLEEGHLCHKACASNFDNLLEWQKSFRVAEFLVVGEHQDLDTEQVIPLQYCPSTAEEGSILQEEPTSRSPVVQVQAYSSDKEKARCGSGSFSEVFRIRMDPSHHRLAVVSYSPASSDMVDTS